jgi:hypothetical protein
MIRFSVVVLFLIPASLPAQTPKNVIPKEMGFAVSVKGDTLFGEINYMKKTGYRQTMQVRIDEQTQKTCNPKQYLYIKAGDHVFESFLVPGGEEKQFFWLKTGGKISLYEYQYELYQLNTTVTKSEYYIRTKGSGELIKLNPGNFKKKLGELVADNPKVSEMLSAKDTKFEALEEIIALYNKEN